MDNPRSKTWHYGTWLAIVMASVLSAGAALGQNGQPADAALRDYLSATGLLNRGMNDLAVAEYRKFLEHHPKHEKAALARYGLSVALFRTKAYDQAIAVLAPLQAVAGFEFAAEAKLILGQCHLEQQEFSKAGE